MGQRDEKDKMKSRKEKYGSFSSNFHFRHYYSRRIPCLDLHQKRRGVVEEPLKIY